MSEHNEQSVFNYDTETDATISKATIPVAPITIHNKGEQQYLDFLSEIMEKGHCRKTRNSTTRQLFSRRLSFDLADGFPLLTTKTMFWRGIMEELKFFLSGKTDATLLNQKKVNIWKDNTSRAFLDSVGLTEYAEGDMGPLYGFQWRHFGATYRGCAADYTGQGVDQLKYVVDVLSSDPYSRRAFMTTYHPDQLTQSPLPPCHGLTVQFGVDGNNRLDCHMYQRSCDAFLGCPFNIASYALLTHLMCSMVNNNNSVIQLVPGVLTITMGDCHVYEDHLDAVREQIARTPLPFPSLSLDSSLCLNNLDCISSETVTLTNYKSLSSIKAPMVA